MPYNGINVLMLWGASVEAGYLSPYWMTFKQAKELGAHVKKGERGNLVVYANTITKTEEQDDGSEEERKIPFMKGYSVFNVEQIEGLPEHYYVKPEPVIDPAQRITHAEDFFAATGADVRHGGNRAYYSGGSDHVQMPVFECFQSPEEPQYVEQKIFAGFYSNADKRLLEEFRAADWTARAELVGKFNDDRLKQLGQRVVFLNAPEMVPETYRAAAHAAIDDKWRANDPKAPWTTAAAVEMQLVEIAEQGVLGRDTIERWSKFYEERLATIGT
jgi:hypothetical protein